MKNADNFAINELLRLVLETVKKCNPNHSTVSNYYSFGINKIRKYYNESGMTNYSKEFTDAIVKQYQDGDVVAHYQSVAKVASMMGEYMATGIMMCNRRKTGSKLLLETAYFQKLLEHYYNFEMSQGARTPTTIECEKILLRHFFARLETNKTKTLVGVTLPQVSAFLTYFAQEKPRSISKMISTLKKLYRFTVQNNISSTDFTPALVSRPSPRKKLRPTLSFAQADKLLASIDRETTLGKRDYAIMMIARHLGVRVGDILNLKKDNINWEKHELTFQQNKTGVELTLPLKAIVGNGVADYILNARPKTEDNHIFIRHNAPYVKLGDGNGIFRRYDLNGEFERGTGFHSFRRGLASQMLNNGTPPDTVKGILGHLKIDSLKPYARISEARLASCALSLQGLETAQVSLC